MLLVNQKKGSMHRSIIFSNKLILCFTKQPSTKRQLHQLMDHVRDHLPCQPISLKNFSFIILVLNQERSQTNFLTPRSVFFAVKLTSSYSKDRLYFGCYHTKSKYSPTPCAKIFFLLFMIK